jgi:short-subunit dehydrogenase
MRTVLVTGASDGIGKSIALALAKEQYNLILLGRDNAKLEKVKASCEALGINADSFAFDLLDDTIRRTTLDHIIASSPPDVLINNAGIWHKVGDITSLSEDHIEAVIGLNLTAQILLTRQLLGGMRQREGSAIINIVSKSGLIAQTGQAVYTASKYGLKGFTDVLREDTKSDPIRIAGVYQSGTNTDLFAKAGDDFPVEKFTDPDDLAQVIVFMLSRPKKLWLNEVHITY